MLSIPGLAFTKCDSALKNEVTFSTLLEIEHLFLQSQSMDMLFAWYQGKYIIQLMYSLPSRAICNRVVQILNSLLMHNTHVWNFLIVISGQVSQQIYLYPEWQSLFYHINLYLKSANLTFIIRPHANWKLVLNPYKLHN